MRVYRKARQFIYLFVVLTTYPHLKTGVDSTPETLCENTLDNGFRPASVDVHVNAARALLEVGPYTVVGLVLN